MKYLLRYPHYFGFNEETAGDNEFQHYTSGDTALMDRKLAQLEFENMVELLSKNGIDVVIMDIETPTTTSPDALFPNNWFSTHPEGLLFTYPMLAANRRTELNASFISSLGEYTHIPLEQHVNEQIYLEGTGSLIIDRDAKLIYASRSERTNEQLLKLVADQLGYNICVFDAFAPSGNAIYHTNVVMHIGKDYVCAGIDLIPVNDLEMFVSCVKDSGKALITLTTEQVMHHFAGNMLQVETKNGNSVLLLSENAFQALSDSQRKLLEQHNDKVLPIAIPTIEQIGGGSVRCMVAEIFST